MPRIPQSVRSRALGAATVLVTVVASMIVATGQLAAHAVTATPDPQRSSQVDTAKRKNVEVALKIPSDVSNQSPVRPSSPAALGTQAAARKGRRPRRREAKAVAPP